MADNVTSPTPDGTVFAFDEVTIDGITVKVARGKFGFGPNGSYTEVDAANRLPVALAGTVPVSLTDQLTLTAFQARTPTLGAKASSGSVSIVPASDAAFPLPAGAATAVNQAAALALDAAFAITPHASNPLERTTKAITIVTGGTVVFRHPDEGSDRTVTLPAGTYPLRATHIRATSTAETMTGW